MSDNLKNYLFDGHKLMYHTDRVSQFMSTGDCYPLYMEISPVASCNHRCIFCAYDFLGHPNRTLKTDRLLGFIGEIAECGVKSLLYAGEGEPLLHPDIDKLVIHSRQSGIDVGMYTNGHLLGEELAAKILPSLTFVRFSFNGGTRDNYAKIHNVKPDVFDKVVRNSRRAVEIKKAKGLNVDIGAQYVLLPENIDCLLDGVRAMKRAGIDYFAIKPFIQQSPSQAYRMKKQFDLNVIGKVLDKAESMSDADFKVVARRESFKKYGKRNYLHCLGTSFISVLNSAGDIASCLPYWDQKEYIFGNIYKNSFREIWSGKTRKKVKEYLEARLDTKGCPPNCRPHDINGALWEMKKPSVKHVNFI